MTTKELIELLQRLDPDGNEEVVFGIDYGEYEKETIVDAETYDDDEVVLYY